MKGAVVSQQLARHRQIVRVARHECTEGQKPVKTAKTLGMFRPLESLNCARIERMTPSMACSENEESIDGIIRSIRALFNDSGGRNMPRVLAAYIGFWPTVERPPTGRQKYDRPSHCVWLRR